MWKIENWEEDVRNTEVTELDTLREHTEYINVVVIKDNIVYSSSGDVNILVHEYPNERAEKVPEEWREAGRAPPKRQPTPQREVGKVFEDEILCKNLKSPKMCQIYAFPGDTTPPPL